MSLYEFFKEARNSVAREKLLHNKLIFDLKLAGSCCQKTLCFTEPEIDKDGYDVIASIGYETLHIQNKTLLSDSTTKAWQIHPIFLSVPFGERDLAPPIFTHLDGGESEESLQEHWPNNIFSGKDGGLKEQAFRQGKDDGYLPLEEGGMGGVLLQEIDAESAKKNELKISYYYFDIFYAAAVRLGLWDVSDWTQDAANTILEQILGAEKPTRISLPKKAFLKITSPAALLAFRFHLPEPTNWVSLAKLRLIDDKNLLKNLYQGPLMHWVDER